MEKLINGQLETVANDVQQERIVTEVYPSSKPSLDIALEDTRPQDEKPKEYTQNDSITLMIFPNSQKHSAKQPDVKIMMPFATGKGWTELGVGWTKTNEKGSYTVIKLNATGTTMIQKEYPQAR